MKKILLMTALAVGFLTSCSEDEEIFQSPVDNNAIAFATKQASTQIQTRAGVTATSLDKFTVSAVNDDNTPFFSSEEFQYDGAVFKSQTPHYWPTTGTLSFYAISDAGSRTVDASNVPMYTYNNWGAEKDLVAATVRAGEKEIPYPLKFQHLTSQIYVSAEAENKVEELTYKLVSVKMTTPSTGTYSFADATGGVGSWVIDNTHTSEYSYDAALPRSFRQNGQIELSSLYWNILPVTDGDLTFRIEYQVLQNNKVICDHTGSNYRECIVENPALVPGKMYRYNFFLPRSTKDEITFSSTIIEWEDNSYSNLTAEVQATLPLFNYDEENKTASVAKYEGFNKYTGAIRIPSRIIKDGVTYTVTSIENMAFYYCEELTSVKIPETVTTIGQSAFYHCEGLESLVIPNSVTSIGDNAFYQCSAMTSLVIGNSLTVIPNSAFVFCTNLKDITIGNSVSTISRGAFDHIKALTTITIPSSVTSIGNSAFGNDTNLKTVIMEPTTPPAFGSYAIHPSFVEVIKVPAGSVDAYKTASGWSQMADRIVAM